MNIARRALKGIFWSYATYIWQRLLTLATTAILARLLVPEDFGLIAFAIIIMALIESVRGFGINDALIYTSEKVEEAAETAFVINTVIGFVQFALAYFLAPYATNFFDDARIVDVLRIISLVFIFDGLGKTHSAMLEKELKFRRSAMPNIIATAIKGLVSIVLAFMGFGVWSIVFGQVIGSITRMIARWWTLRWIPRLHFYTERARALWDYGVHVLIFTLLNVALEQADQILIGTMLGQLQLGYYAIGVRFPELVIANFSLILTKALFPAFSKFQNDVAKMKNGYLMTTKYTAFLTVPMGLGMVAVAREVVLVIFGSQWEPAIILMQVLALLGMVATLQWSVGDVLKALGRPDVLTKLQVVEAIYTFPMIYGFVVVGRLAVMASLANLIAITMGAITRMFVIARFLDIKPKVFYTMFRSPFVNATIMVFVIWVWRTFAYSLGLPLLVILITSIVIGIIVYAAGMWLMEKDALLKAREMVLSTIRSKKGDDDEDDNDDNENPEIADKSDLMEE
ncbi:MAG: lipopolysaccharide biosynthesis protein [Anaerolineae bacterium]|nr:lipopolysaccharide biosynthesis protein [Anaerolineae bacterium]